MKISRVNFLFVANENIHTVFENQAHFFLTVLKIKNFAEKKNTTKKRGNDFFLGQAVIQNYFLESTNQNHSNSQCVIYSS